MTGAITGLKTIVTGAANGLGRAIAQRFAHEGATVAMFDRDADALEEAVGVIRADGGTAFPVPVDLARTDRIADAVAHAAAELGGIDILCNNAAIAVRQAIEDQSEDDWDVMMAINLRAYFSTAKFALPHLRQSTHKAIVNVSSMAGSFGIAGLAAYCASKGGVDALTRALAVELAPEGIRVNCVSPGSMLTPAMAKSIAHIDSLGRESGQDAIARLTNRQLFRRVADPAEVAAIVLFLASNEASYLTGENINASGGWAAH